MTLQTYHEIRPLNRLSRGEIEAALNWAGYATYDRETTEDLRRVLAACIDDGEITLESIEVTLRRGGQS